MVTDGHRDYSNDLMQFVRPTDVRKITFIRCRFHSKVVLDVDEVVVIDCHGVVVARDRRATVVVTRPDGTQSRKTKKY